MWSLAIVAFAFVSLSSAFPTLLERPEQKPQVFVVQVSEPKRLEQPTVEAQKRDFPWPYPPVFEAYLPEEAKQRLVVIYMDSSLSNEERASRVNSVFDSLSQETIQQLPLPTEYDRLPVDVYQRIQYVHVAPGFKWAERQALIRDIIEGLPEAERQLLSSPRIGGPPPGFEFVLAPTVYKQLLFVHHNPRLTKEQKSQQITLIMRQVPQEQLERLPLPRGMEQLPMELQKRLRSLVYDYSVAQPERAQRVRQFIDQLPAELRPPLRR